MSASASQRDSSQDTQPPTDIQASEPATRDQFYEFIDILHYEYTSLSLSICSKLDPTSPQDDERRRLDKIKTVQRERRSKLGMPFFKTYTYPIIDEAKALPQFYKYFTPERARSCIDEEKAFFKSVKEEHWGKHPFPLECICTRLDPNKKVEPANSDLAVSDRFKSAPGRATLLQFYNLGIIFGLYDELEGRVRSMSSGGQIDPVKQARLDKAAEDKRARLEEIGLDEPPMEPWAEFYRFSPKYSKEEADQLLMEENHAIEKWESGLGLGSVYEIEDGLDGSS